MSRKPAPFRVYKVGPVWELEMRQWPTVVGDFPSPAEAIDYAYRHWPWWP